MKKYFVRYFIQTPNSISDRKDLEVGKFSSWKFNFDNSEIGLYDHKEGLFSDCYIESESLDSVQDKSNILIENVLNLIDFSTSSVSSPPLLISIYDASLNLSVREYKQVFYIPILERNIIVIDEEIFKKIFNIFNKNRERRIVRSTAWLRKGYSEEEYVDKFIAFWTGLESINELLEDYFKIPTDDRKMKCKKCGELLHPITAGIERLFTKELKIDEMLFKKIRKARGKLLHGGVPLDDNFINEIEEYNPIVKKALITGLGKLLQIDDEVLKNIIQQKSKRYTEKYRIIVRANLINFDPPNLEEIGKQPGIDLINKELLERTINHQGKLNIKDKIKFENKNAEFEIISIEGWVEDNTSITKAEFYNIRKAN